MKQEVRSTKKGMMKGITYVLSVTILLFLLSSFAILPAPSVVHAQSSNEDITSSNFSLVVCDGPDMSKVPGGNPRGYRVCDFRALMVEGQHLINILIILGVLFALVGFSYAGFLYIWHGSESGKRDEANEIFKKVFIGFIIMLTAWVLVYQILSWLTCSRDASGACSGSGINSVFSSLLHQ